MHEHGTSWTEKEILEELNKIVEVIGRTHFPTREEMVAYTGSHGLAVAITRTGGTREWSKRINLTPSACSNTIFGNIYEKQAMKDIEEETGLYCERMRERYPYDIYVNNLVKVDIKSSMPIKGRKFNVWSFNLEKKEPTCDIYIFYCANTNGEIMKRLIIPACVLSGLKQIGIGTLSRYDNFIERWDIITEYNKFLSDVKDKIDMIPKRRTTEKNIERGKL